MKLIGGPFDGKEIPASLHPGKTIAVPSVPENSHGCSAFHLETVEYVVVDEREARWHRSFTSLNPSWQYEEID